MNLMLNPFRRHSKTCPHAHKGRAWRTCKCTVWVEGTLGNERIQKSLDTRDWRKAQDEIHKMEMAGKIERNESIESACKLFIEDCTARHLAGSTLKKFNGLLLSKDCNSLTVFTAQRGADSIRRVDLDMLTEWRSEWKDAAITQSKKLERLRVFFRWCVARGYCDKSPAIDLKAPKVRHVPTMPFTRSEVVQLLAMAPTQGFPEEGARLRAFILLCRYSGLRRTDAATMPVAKLHGNRLMLYTAKTGVPVFTVLPPAAVDALNYVPRVSEAYWFWTGQSSTETVGGNFGRAFHRLCEKCGIKGGHLHRLRDTFAVELLLAGVPIQEVSILLGHSSIRVTEKHYAPWVKSRQELLEASLAKAWMIEDLEATNPQHTHKTHEKVQ